MSAWTHKIGFLLLFSIPTCIAVLTSALSHNIFEANSLILVSGARSGDIDAFGRPKGSLERQEQTVNTQVYIIESEEVLKNAIDKVGEELLRYRSERGDSGHGLSSYLRDMAKKYLQSLLDDGATQVETKESLENEKQRNSNAVLLDVRSRMKVQVERNTDLLRVSFRHRDPVLAARFTNALVNSFLDRTFNLYGNPESLKFFVEQEKEASNKLRSAQEDLVAFSTKSRVFSVEEQRKLLLARRNELVSAALSSRSAAVEKEVQEQTLAQQLLDFRPLSSLPQIAALARSAGAVDKGRGLSDQSADPPILLVRAYQETLQTLVKLSAEVAGLRALNKQHQKELDGIDRELSDFSSRQPEFDRLVDEVAAARRNAEAYEKRSSQERLEFELRTRKLLNVQVAQRASIPSNPVFPRPDLIIPLGILAGLICAFGIEAIRVFSADN